MATPTASGSPPQHSLTGEYWSQDIIAVTVQGPVSNPQSVADQLNQYVFANHPVLAQFGGEGGSIVYTTKAGASTVFLRLQTNSAGNYLVPLWNTVQQINLAIYNGTLNSASGSKFAGASPDWSLLGSHYGAGVAGSPSGPYQSYSPHCIFNAPKAGGEGETVYVLDTADQPIVNEVPNSDYIGGNPLLTSIAGSASPTAASPGQTEAPHGLFIAALIHHLASGAHIVLVQVLNDNGVGDLDSLAWGLGQASSSGIVNLSLEAAAPPGLLLALWNCSAYTGKYGVGSAAANPAPDPAAAGCTMSGSYSTNLSDPYEQYLFVPIMSLLGLTQSTIVAAAGNDNGRSAGMPAAFCQVSSVASVPYTGTSALSTFSNHPGVDDGSGSFAGCLDLVPNTPPAACAPSTATPTGTPTATPTSTPGTATNCGPVSVVWNPSRQSTTVALAPGERICSLIGNNQYAIWQGTSFAAAIYSGNLADQAVTYLPSNSISDSQPCS